MTATEEFITNFNSLTGITIGERRKNLFYLLKRTKQSLDLESTALDFTIIQPKTPLEESFLVETLIYFRRVPELINVLKSENPILIEKVLKVSSWFLEEMLKNINEKELVEQLFPCLSFNVKVKLINQLALHLKNPNQADAIFEAIDNRYGLFLATKLLPCCNKDNILRYMKVLKIELTPSQLLIIVKKHPELTESIFKALQQFYEKNVISCKYKNIFKYLIKSDMLLFLKLHKEYQPSFCIGWRATDKLVLLKKDDVIKNASRLYTFLHKKQIKKCFSHDYGEFYLNMFPSSLGRFRCDLNFYIELVENLPSNVSKLDLLLSTFKRSYGSELWDHYWCITPRLLELMTPDERETWMQKNQRPINISEDAWTCLKKTDVSIPLLKKKISLTFNIKERAGLIGNLIETCRINRDKVALTAVCQYVAVQHRNDNNALLLCFLKTLNNCFCLDSLNDEQWKSIMEIVHVFIARKQIPFYYHTWFSDNIHYRLVNQLPVKEQLINMSKKMLINNVGSHVKEAEYQKKLLLIYGEVISEIHDEESLENSYIEFLNSVAQYNRKNRNDEIPLLSYSQAVNALKNSLKKQVGYNYLAGVVAVDCLKLKMSENDRIEWLDLLCTAKTFYADMSTMEWLIKHEPSLVARYLEPLVNIILDMWYTLIHSFFWKYCKNYTHVEIPQNIIKICLKIINDGDENESRKKNAMTALSYLMEPNEFLKVIAPYYPTDLQIDVNSEENQETYKLQQAITACLKNVIPHSVVIESVLNFSKGDYLKYIQRSLHSVCLSAAENKLEPLFSALTDRAVSVRKHAIYHTFKVLDKTEIYRMLTKLMETEKNSSIRKFLFKGTFNYFAKNPNDYLWSLVKQNATALDVNDNEAFEMLMEIDKVPLQYLSNYIMFTWNILETLPNPANSVLVGKCRLLTAINQNVAQSLINEFCWGIIETYFLKPKELSEFHMKIIVFACKYILYSATEQEQRLMQVFEILKNYINSTWCNSEMKTVGRNVVQYFVKQFCLFFLDESFVIKNSSAKNILVKFMELWNNMLQPQAAFSEYIHMELSLLFVDYITNDLTLDQIGEKLGKLCDSLLNAYGPLVNGIFGESLKPFICNFMRDSVETLEIKQLMLVESIMKHTTSPNCLIMIVSLLPEALPTIPEVKVMYDGVMNRLYEISDFMVQITLSCYVHKIYHQVNDSVVYEGKLLNNDERYKKQKQHLCFIEDYNSKYRDKVSF